MFIFISRQAGNNSEHNKLNCFNNQLLLRHSCVYFNKYILDGAKNVVNCICTVEYVVIITTGAIIQESNLG